MKTLYLYKELIFLMISVIFSFRVADYVVNLKGNYMLHLAVLTTMTFVFYITIKVIEVEMLKKLTKNS